MAAIHDAYSWKTGTVVGGRYKIIGAIGHGGMGVVYAAEDLRLDGKLRAVKAVKVHAAAGSHRRFTDEAQVLMRLNHPNLPVIVDYDPPDDEGMEWIVMDYIAGQTVYALIQSRKTPLAFADTIAIALQLCSALSYLHEQSPPIIHRDLKPSNVMIDERGAVRLIDFGIARYYKAAGDHDTVLLGTPGFAAPEQLGGGQSGEWTDIYGLGALMLYMLQGAVNKPIKLIRNGSLQHSLGMDAPRSFVRVVEKMLDEKPERRYRSMREVEAELLRFVPEQTSRSVPANIIREGQRIYTAAVVGLSAGAGATFIAVTIAKVLAKQGVRVAALEAPGQHPQWHALLGGSPAVAEYMAAGLRDGQRYVSFVGDDHVKWHMVNPMLEARSPLLYRELEQLGHLNGYEAAIIDLSSSFDSPDKEDGLRRADLVIVAADPYVSGWESGRLLALRRLAQDRLEEGLDMMWLANKDVSFRLRKEWLRLLPAPPAACFPLIPASEVLNAIWSSGWFTDSPKGMTAAEEALKPLWQRVVRRVRTKSG